MVQDPIKFAVGLTGKTAKDILTDLERYLHVEKLDPTIRKIILDRCAELARDQEKILKP